MRCHGLLARAGALAVLVAPLVGVQCGGGSQTAKDPSTENTSPPPEDTSSKWEEAKPQPTSKPTSGGSGERRGDQYDKDATEIVLKRATRQVKDNCGQMKDENGKLTGPYGKVTVSLTLGHNGHMKAVKVPPAFDGKPTGKCVVQSFDNVIFPPWAGADTPLDWEVEVVEPGK